jgi:membrane fusion protein (multidrug efflux system)
MNAATITPLPALDQVQRATLSPTPTPAAERDAQNPSYSSTLPSPAAAPKRGPSRKQAVLTALALAAALGGAKLTYDWWTVGRHIESTDDAYVGGDVTVIAPKVSGFIAEVAVGDNQAVHAGDLLLRLDDRDYRAALAKAEAVVANRRATLDNLDATRHLQEAMVSQTEAEIVSAEAEISRAQDDQARYLKLSQGAAVSVQSFQKADADYKQALAAGERARAGLAAAQRKLEVIATEKQQAQAALEQALAERDIARLNLGYTELRAPMDGIVGNRSARAGAYAPIGAQLVSLVPSQGLWIDANYKESQLAQTRPGSPATVRVDSLPGREFHGHVVSVAPATGAQFSVLPPENATGNFTKIVQRVAVRIVLEDEAATGGQLRPGLSVTAEVDGRTTGKASL